VSAPLLWKEVKPGLHPSQFHMGNMLQRVEKKGDLFEAVLGKGFALQKALALLQKMA
jgi:bifunctional non-homologous end joining protein LigD